MRLGSAVSMLAVVRPALFLALSSVLLGCGSIDEEEVEDAVERGVEGARRGIERTWDAAVDAYEDRKRAPSGSESAEPLAGAEAAISCERPGESCTVAYAFVAEARANGEALAEQVRMHPVSSPAVGMRLDGMRSGSAAEHLGLEVGDVVTHVNGIAVGDTMRLFMNVRAARVFVVDYRRGDDERTLTLEAI